MIKLNIGRESLDTVCKILIGVALGLNKQDPLYLEKLCPIIEFLEETVEPSVGAAICYISVLEKLPQEIRRKIPRPLYLFIKDNLFEIEETMGRKIPEAYRPEVIVNSTAKILGADGQPIWSSNMGVLQ